MLERCWNDVGNDVGTMLERCSTSRFAEIGQPFETRPGKEIGTPSLKAVGQKKHFFILPPWPSLKKKAPTEKYSVDDEILPTMS